LVPGIFLGRQRALRVPRAIVRQLPDYCQLHY
jgi:hypothetical protein